MDCKNARLLMELTRPGGGELDAADAEALEQHLADCPDCGPVARDERRADEHLGRAMRDVPVPAGLRERILQKLPADPGPSAPRRWPWRYLGAAAAVFVVAGLGLLAWRLWFSPRPAVDVVAFAQEVNGLPFVRTEDREKKVVEDFKALGVTMVPPPKFDYNLLDSYGLVVFKDGQQVPQLRFFTRGDKDSPPALALVYVLSSRQFNLEQTLENAKGIPSGTRMVEVHPDGNYLYLIEYTGHSLNPFMRQYTKG
jgi:hypothetical protein